ncbi:MAG: BlaI/MecI/CopY family transcriptional regulator [Tepidisphaeraceae bacterium]
MPPDAPVYTDGELEILKVIWTHGPCGIATIQEKISTPNRAVALTTVATRVKRMEQKGLIRASDDRRPRLYVTAVEQQATAGRMVSEILGKIFDKATAAKALHLFGKFSQSSAKQRKKIEDELDQM